MIRPRAKKKKVSEVPIDQIELSLWVIVAGTLVFMLLLMLCIFSVLRIRTQSYEIACLKAGRAQVQEDVRERQVRTDELILEKERQLSSQEALLSQKSLQLNEAREQIQALSQIKERHIELQARFDEKEAQLQSQAQLLDESKKTLLREFELAANKLFESKQQSFSQTSKQGLETVLSPFKQQLKDFNKQVEDVYHKENTQRNQLIGQIGELQKQTKQISEDANNLASALKGDNKVQGQWGEIILERLLEQSGLEKGREYDTQNTYKNEDGKNFRPDVIIHLPEEKDIVVDSKVALVEYERYVNEGNEERKAASLKAHVESVRTHMKGLSLKKYEQLEGIKTLDFVFMFVPVEAAYVTAVQSSPDLFQEAYDKNIMLVSPSSLMVALRTVETMWRYEKQNANAEKIATSAGKLYDQFVLVVNAMEDVGGYISKANDSYDTVLNRLSRGRGNVLKRIDDLKKLGAKAAKSMPKRMQDRLDSDEVAPSETSPIDKVELIVSESEGTTERFELVQEPLDVDISKEDKTDA